MEKRTALLSVYDKTGIIEFARQLIELDFDIFASGGTAKTLQEAGIAVTDVKTIVGDPILGHRVVTLSREIHAGLLAQDNEIDRAELQRLGIKFIDLVCCDFYPLKEEGKDINATIESIIEKTDIGGPTMLRSAAKGNRIVIATPGDRILVLHYLKEGKYDFNFINRLAAKAEFIVAQYCMYSAHYRSGNLYRAKFTDYTGVLHDSTLQQEVIGDCV